MLKKMNGFTLIELMIVVVVVSVLAAVAVPSYRETVMKSRREDAKGALMGLANAMEKHFTENNSYCNAGGTGGADTCGDGANDTGKPSIYSDKSPVDGSKKYYDLTISAALATTYTLTATPAGGQAGDICGTLTLDHTGATTHSSGTAAQCE